MQIKSHDIIRFLSLPALLLLLTSGYTPFTTAKGAGFSASHYEISVAFSFEGRGEFATLEAYLPVSDDRQEIRVVNHAQAGFNLQSLADENGRRFFWRRDQAAGAQCIRYTFQFSGSAATYMVPANLPVASSDVEAMERYLEATPSIPAENSFIRRQAGQLKAEHRDLSTVLDAFFAYTSGLSDQPGPAFSALFYGRRDWKNYLFLALCRSQGIAARVVNGLEIGAMGTYQLRQWAEVYAGGVWIPVDASARHFAFLPENYLTLYRGEHPALQHSANIAVNTSLEIVPTEGLIGALVR